MSIIYVERKIRIFLKGEKIMNIYSKENLEGLVFDLIKYLYKTKDYKDTYEHDRLSKDVLIYSMNKCYSVSEKNSNFMLGKIPIYIEDNIDMEKYFEYCDKKTLVLSMDSILNEYLYYGDVPNADIVRNRVSDIFEDHGFYYDFGSNWYIFAVPLEKSDESE